METILDSIKDKIAGGAIHEHFDSELIDAINSAILDLRQIGIGPDEGYVLKTGYETWEDYLGEDLNLMASVKTLISLKVRRLFDPSASSAIGQVQKEEIERLEWRLQQCAEFGL